MFGTPGPKDPASMTPEHVRNAVEHIHGLAHDAEAAHGMEDGLHKSVLEAIAQGAKQPRLLASLALATEYIEFGRWCG